MGGHAGLWNRGRGTASELQRDLAEDHGWAYSTVKTMLDRLVEKGYAKTCRVGNVYEIHPRWDGSRPSPAWLTIWWNGFWRGVGSSVSRLISQPRLSPQEIAELRAMLDQYQDEADA